MSASCELETRMIAALRAGNAGEDMLSHMRKCRSCADAAIVWQFFEWYSAAEVTVPSGESIWWRAEMSKNRSASKRITKIITCVETAACMAVALMIIACMRSQAPSVTMNVPPEYLLGSVAAVIVPLIAAFICSVWMGSGEPLGDRPK